MGFNPININNNNVQAQLQANLTAQAEATRQQEARQEQAANDAKTEADNAEQLANQGNASGAKAALAKAKSHAALAGNKLPAGFFATAESAIVRAETKFETQELKRKESEAAKAKEEAKAKLTETKTHKKEEATKATVAAQKADEELKKQETKRTEEQQVAKARVRPPMPGESGNISQEELIMLNALSRLVLAGDKLENPLKKLSLNSEERSDAVSQGVITKAQLNKIEASEMSPEYDKGAQEVRRNLVVSLIMNGVPAKDLHISTENEQKLNVNVETGLS